MSRANQKKKKKKNKNNHWRLLILDLLDPLVRSYEIHLHILAKQEGPSSASWWWPSLIGNYLITKLQIYFSKADIVIIHSDIVTEMSLTPLLRRPYIHAISFSTACRTACKHAFRFLRVLPEAVSTRHSWLWQTLDDVYTHRCFSESEGTRFGAPGQKAMPSVNEFTLLWIFA